MISSKRDQIMRQSLILLFLLAVPLSVHAQADLTGPWTLAFMMDDATRTMDVNAEVVQDTLHLTVSSDHGTRALEKVSFNDDVLQFDFPSGHGSVACILYKKDDDGFSGICEGPAGEIPTTMKRSEDSESE